MVLTQAIAHAVTLFIALVPPLPTPKPAAEPALFPSDPVVLITSGTRTAGLTAWEVVHDGVRYQFTTEATKLEFTANPAKYALAESGACARMGPLSGACSFERSEVVDGRIYVFASDRCRTTFMKAPRDFPEPTDAAIEANDAGRALATKARAWMHADQLPASGIILSSRSRYTEESLDAYESTEHRVGPQLQFGELYGWNEKGRYSAWWTDANFAGSSASGRKISNRSPEITLDALQLRALRRKAMLEPAFLAAVLVTPDAVLRREGPQSWTIVEAKPLDKKTADEKAARTDADAPTEEETVTGEALRVHWHGVTIEWLIDAASGEPLAQRARQRNEDSRITTITTRFESWTTINGALVPLMRRNTARAFRFDAVELRVAE